MQQDTQESAVVDGISRRVLLRRLGVGAGAAAATAVLSSSPALAQTGGVDPDALLAPRRDRHMPDEVVRRDELDTVAEELSQPVQSQAYAHTITESVTFAAQVNMLSVGPVEIADGAGVTVNGNWTIV